MESFYGNAVNYAFTALNPFKKMIIQTQCEVHKYINDQALNILKNEYYINEHSYFNHFISDIDEGTVWADQDFKSSSHFYNPQTNKGLYGRSNAMDLAIKYHDRCLGLMRIGGYQRAMFYFGATVHLIQDMTIPQHANIRILGDHRHYEDFIKSSYQYIIDFKVETGTYKLNSLESYIQFNAKIAMSIYKKFKNIKNNETRFYKMAACTLPLAQRTTAGFMVLFFNRMFQ